MEKINSGTYKFCSDKSRYSKNELCYRVMAGIRANPAEYVGTIPIEHIFVAITGYDGAYRSSKELTKILEDNGIEVAFVHEKQAKTQSCEAFYIRSYEDHQKLFEELHQYADIVYPEPSDQDAEQEEEQEKGEDRPF